MLRFRLPLQQLVFNNCKTVTSVQKRTKVTSVSSFGGDNQKAQSDSSMDAAKQQSTDVKEAAETKPKNVRSPLVKNFFVGVVDRELLAFPEVITRESMAELQNEVLPLVNFFAEPVNIKTPAIIDNIRELGLYSINVPQEFGGKGWNWSSTLMATEPETKCTDAALNLLSHRVVIDLLNESGSPEQQKMFLQKLGEGSLVATEAIFEYNAPENDFFNTTASYAPETNEWTLSGEKSFVVTGPLPTGSKLLFLVIAQTQRNNMTGDASRGTTLFLVDSSLEGVQLAEQHQTFGCRGVEMRQIKFNNVRVHGSFLLGIPHEGNAIADILLRAGRLRQSAISLGLLKEIVNELCQYNVNNKFCGLQLSDMESTQINLSKVVSATYALESMLYLTAGLFDEFHKQDIVLEAAITKYFSLDQLMKLTNKCMEMIGPKTLHTGQPIEIFARNAAQLYTQNESVDSLRLYIGATGLNHAGAIIHETVRMSRNPLYNPGHILGRFLQRSTIESPNTKMALDENLHPTLAPAAQCIEHSVARLQMCVDLLLTRYGNTIVERHNELNRLAEISTNIYAMFSSAARASRAYCIGLQFADNELLIATGICSHGSEKVKTLSLEIMHGEFVNNDKIYKRLSKQICKSKGYYPKHPLTFNF